MPKKRPVSNVTIYGLFDPRTDELHYVGQTGQPLWLRLEGHISEAQSNRDYSNLNRSKISWIRELLNVELAPEIRALEIVPSASADRAERAHIARNWGRGRLFNFSETPVKWCGGTTGCRQHGHHLDVRLSHDVYIGLRLAAAMRGQEPSEFLDEIVADWLQQRTDDEVAGW